MNPTLDFVEFYVSCNPPLRPNGVRYVVNSANKAFLNDEIIELLFEPEVPWFKIITRFDKRTVVYEHMQNLLGNILEEETGLLDPNQFSPENSGSNIQADVDVIVAHPRIVPWPIFADSERVDHGAYDVFRFPVTMQDLKHKTIWRGLEKRPGQTIHTLFSSLGSLWKDANLPLTISQLEAVVKCIVTHNLGANVLYIGTDESIIHLQGAVQKLENLIYALKMTRKTATHVIHVENRGEVRMSYRWLSQLGLAKKTYLQAPEEDLEDEYRRLMASATWRTLSKDRTGQWVSDPTVYPDGAEPDPASIMAQSGFENYQHTMKSPSAWPRAVDALKTTLRASDKSVILADGVSQEKAPTLPRPPAAALDERSPESADASKSSNNRVQTAGSVITWRPPSSGILSSRDAITKWRDCVEKACQPDPSEPKKDDLISFDAVEIHVPPAVTREPTVTEQVPPEQSDDLISFDVTTELDPVMASLMDDNRPLREGLTLLDDVPEDVIAQANPSIAGLQPGSEDGEKVQNTQPILSQNAPNDTATGDEVVQFGILKTTPRDYFRTMNQHVGRRKRAMTSVGLESLDLESLKSSLQSSPAQRKAEDRPHGDAELQMKEMVAALEVTPGNISLEAKFGRVYYKDIQHSMVDLGTGPNFGVSEILAALNNSSFPEQCLGFSTFLSRQEADAGLLPLVQLSRRATWELFGRDTFYDFSCSIGSNDSKEQFVVEIDAESFEYRPRGTNEELSTVYAHCPQRAWDMKFCCTRSNALHLRAKYQKIAQDLTLRLGISMDNEKQVLIEITRPGTLGITISRVDVRHVAMYRQGRSALTVSTTRPMIRRQVPRNQRPEPAEKRTSIFWGVSDSSTDRWIEASITSLQTERLFKENVGLDFGDRVTWNCEQLDAEGGYNDICTPAFAMICRMDEIGHTNDNRQGFSAYAKYHDTLEEKQKRLGKFAFW